MASTSYPLPLIHVPLLFWAPALHKNKKTRSSRQSTSPISHLADTETEARIAAATDPGSRGAFKASIEDRDSVDPEFQRLAAATILWMGELAEPLCARASMCPGSSPY